jgi:uncharacterized protein (TIGR02596 family)
MNRSLSTARLQRGFTLVEMLAVIGVIALITLAVVPQVFSTLNATKLTSAGDTVLGQISLARQMAVSRNREIEMRFYYYAEPGFVGTEQLIKAIALVEPVPSMVTGAGAGATTRVVAEPVMETYYLPAGIAISRTSNLSPLLASGSSGQRDVERLVRKAVDAAYYAIRFFPDGSTDISLQPNRCYLTIGEERLVSQSGSTSTPDNFYAVQVDPLTGRVRSFRPGI